MLVKTNKHLDDNKEYLAIYVPKIEIESEGRKKENSRIIQKFLRKTKWETKNDESLRKGTEVVSPVLKGDNEKTSNEIKSVCAILNGIDQGISKRCGGHVHIGADYLKSKQDWTNLIKIWSNAEKVLYVMCNKEGVIPRMEIMEYAEPISKKVEDAIKKGTINLESKEDLSKFAKEMVKVQESRQSSINFCNVGNKYKNTIEFRVSNGTIDPVVWIENINLFGGIIRRAHELSIIQAKAANERREDEIKLLDSFEKLQTEENEEQIAKALVDLCIEPEDRHIYIDRYFINHMLLEFAPDLKDEIVSKISTSKIGKKIFTGDKAITGEEYEKGKQIIEHIQKSLEEKQGKGGKAVC